MGRNRKGWKKQKAGGGNWQQTNQKNYNMAVRENALFEKYYQGQQFVPEDEWVDFYKILQQNLPVTFRITGNRKQAKELLKIIKGQYFSNLVNMETGGEPFPPPKCLQWYPDELAWQLDTSRKMLRSNDVLKRLHEFLVSETESGNLSRQEAVSMIPPLLLDIQPHHKILDLCAAPGSKTAQLIEYLHAEDNNSKLVPDGFIVANDVDNKRCYLMVHQVKRLQSPCCVIVNHDATFFPNFRVSANKDRPEFIQFDRILADVPCSGDGTMRKNPDVWQKWNPVQGYNMHGLQQKILRRALELLTVGGRLVYSTCSFNPVENEAVLAEMLQKYQGAVELVDVSEKLPGLKSIPGLSTWKCMSRSGEWYDKYEYVPAHLQTQIRPSMFPPSPDVSQTLNLNRCVRVLPHHQNTGGFFISVLQKTRPLPGSREAKMEVRAAETFSARQATPASTNQEEAETNNNACPMDLSSLSTRRSIDTESTEGSGTVPEASTSQITAAAAAAPAAAAGSKTDTDVSSTTQSSEVTGEKRKAHDNQSQPPKKTTKMRGYKEDPFLFLKPDDPVWPPIRDFYQLDSEFPCTQMLYRSEQGSKRSLYFVSKALQQLVEWNVDKIKFINMGVKILSRSPSPIVPQCDFRVTQEGLSTLYRLFPGRHVNISKEDAVIILSQENPFTNKLSSPVQERLADMGPGSTIFCFKPTEECTEPECEVVFCGWRGKVSVRSFVGRCERQHNLMLFGLDLNEINAQVAKLKALREQESLRQAELIADQPELDIDSGDSESESNGVEGEPEKKADEDSNGPMDLSVKKE